MPQAEETEETKAEETAPDETGQEPNAESADFDKELAEQIENFERAEKAREGYAKRKGMDPAELDAKQQELNTIEEQVAEAIKKQLPKLQATMAQDTVENVLKEISSSDSEKKLILWHFENSVAPNGTIRERLENAKLIANKKSFLKTQKEMAVAINNRAGLNSSGLGTSTEGPTVKDQFFSDDQLKTLRARGFDDKKIERLKANLRKQKSF